MKIDSASEYFTVSSQTEPSFMPPCPTTAIMDIIDKLADWNKRKTRNILVYNLPEPFSKSDSDAFYFSLTLLSIQLFFCFY